MKIHKSGHPTKRNGFSIINYGYTRCGLFINNRIKYVDLSWKGVQKKSRCQRCVKFEKLENTK